MNVGGDAGGGQVGPQLNHGPSDPGPLDLREWDPGPSNLGRSDGGGWDVIVVGARVAGAATAMLLARAGMRVLCVDRSRYGSDTISTHALMRGGVIALQQWGLLEALVAAGTPPVRRTVFHYGPESAVVSIKASGGVDALYAPRRTVLDPLLVDAAQAAGAVFEFGVQVTGLLRDPDGAVTGVQLRGSHHGGQWAARAPLVIGADGRDSLVAREVGALPYARGHQAGSYLYGYWSGLPTDGYEWTYRPHLTAGTIPTNDGLTCVFIGSLPARLDPVVRARGARSAFDLMSVAVGLGDRIGAAVPSGSVRHVRGLPAGYLRPAHGPGWALVGDAGHWMDPMGTHGITAALRDAGLLARAVLATGPTAGPTAGLHTGPTTGLATGGRNRALDQYQAVRDRLSHPMLEVTEEVAAYSWDLDRIRILLRRLSSAMADEVETMSTTQVAA